MSLIYNKWPPKHVDRIQLYSLATPNGMKVGIALVEMELDFDAHLINITKDDQFTAEFVSVNPNSKIPAIIDPNGPGGKAISIMESGAILYYLAEKTGKLIPSDPIAKNECLQWMFFQVGHIGPMLGQFGHFFMFAKDKCKDPYPLKRYGNETKRLLVVLEKRLTNRDYVLDYGYSIADIMIFPWVDVLLMFYKAEEYLYFSSYPNVKRWLENCLDRPAVQEGMQVCRV